MTKVVSVLWKNRWRQNEEERYKMCHESSLMMKDLIDKHFLTASWSCMIQFIYDSVFWTIVLFWCFWWIIIRCLRRRIQMRMIFFWSTYLFWIFWICANFFLMKFQIFLIFFAMITAFCVNTRFLTDNRFCESFAFEESKLIRDSNS
jgi:predicted membrane protein